MLERFYPDFDVQSVYHIDFKTLYREGYRGILFDIDNTLVPHGAPADERIKTLFQTLQKIGFRVMLLSNNKEPRVKMFNDAVGADYIFRAGKPAVASYIRAMEKMQTTAENTIFVGDQLFTDILGAKKAGIRNYLVSPIHPKEEIQIVLKRYLEKIVLYFYHRRKDDRGHD